jgi:hypothetical protein
MSRHRRDCERIIQAELAAQGLGPATFERRASGHIRASFTCRDGKVRTVSFTPHDVDCRAHKNLASSVRRFARGDAQPQELRS